MRKGIRNGQVATLAVIVGLCIFMAACGKSTTKAASTAPMSCIAGPGEICAPQWWIDDLSQFKDAQNDLNGTGATPLAKEVHERSITFNGLSSILNNSLPKNPTGVPYTYNEDKKAFDPPPVPVVKQDPGAAPTKK